MGRCRGGPFEFPDILLRPLRPPRRAGGRTTKMNSNTYLNNTYKSNERALADLLGQLVRGRNSSPTGFNRGVGGGSGVSGGGGPMGNYGSPSMGSSSGGGGWGGNAPNDWNQGGVGGGFGGGGGGGVGNIMPLMQRGGGMNMSNSGGGGGGGYGGMPQGSGVMNDNFGGMQQGNDFMGMSRGNQGGYGGMQPNQGMNSGGFGGGGFPQSDFNNFGGDGGFGGGPSPQGGRSRGTWISGAANRTNRIAAPPRGSSRPSNSTPARRSLSGTKAPLSSRNNRSGAASASGNTSRSGQALKRKAPAPSNAPTKAKISTNNTRSTSVQGNKTDAAAAEPRRVLTTTGGRWYQHFLTKGLKPEEARKKAFENNNKPFTAGTEGAAKKNIKKSRPPPAETYVRLAIFAKGFPENMLDPEDLSSIEELIVDEVANSSAESKLQFERLLRKPGMLIVDCLNQQTADWLTDIIPKLTNWENPELAICSEENIPEAYVMTISLPSSIGQDYDQTLALIQSQNSDLVTDSWEWVHEREDGDRLVVTIRIDKESHAAIKEKRWKLYYKFGILDVSFARYVRFALSKRLHEEAEAINNESKEDEPKAEEGEEETTAEATEEGEESPPSPPPAPVISK